MKDNHYPAFPVTCPECGYITERRNRGRKFRCPRCGEPLVAELGKKKQ